MNSRDLDLLVDTLLDLRDAKYELEAVNSRAHQAQLKYEAEREKVADLEERLKKQESMHLTEFFARHGDGDAYDALESRPYLKLPPGWELCRYRGDDGSTQEIEHVLKLESPSKNLWHSTIRVAAELQGGHADLQYLLDRQRMQVLASALDEHYAAALLASALDEHYAAALRERSGSIDGYHFSKFDYFHHRY